MTLQAVSTRGPGLRALRHQTLSLICRSGRLDGVEHPSCRLRPAGDQAWGSAPKQPLLVQPYPQHGTAPSSCLHEVLVALNDVGVLQLVQQLNLPQAAPPCLLIHHLKDLHLQPGAVSQASAPQPDAAVAQLQAAQPDLCQCHALGSALQEGFKLLVRRTARMWAEDSHWQLTLLMATSVPLALCVPWYTCENCPEPSRSPSCRKGGGVVEMDRRVHQVCSRQEPATGFNPTL